MSDEDERSPGTPEVEGVPSGHGTSDRSSPLSPKTEPGLRHVDARPEPVPEEVPGPGPVTPPDLGGIPGDPPVNGPRGEGPDLEGLTEFSELVSVTQSYTGPLPPAMLREFNDLVPGFAERYLGMTERTVTGHIDRDDKLAAAEIEAASTGQVMAFLLTVLAMIAAVVFFAVGNDIAGVAFLSVPLLMLIRSFLGHRAG